MLPAETAVLLQLDAIGGVLAVLLGVVIALFAFGASKCNLDSFTVSSHERHLRYLNF
jgi:hypothetical protein